MIYLTRPMNEPKKIAIIGAGISGLSAAYFLKDTHDITLFEKSDRLGGHSRTIEIKTQENEFIKVDTGFIVLNDRTYPNLNKLFAEIDIDIEKTEMSFAVSVNEGNIEWSGTSVNTLFAQRKNLFNIKMLRGVRDILTFNKSAANAAKNNPHLTLGELIVNMKLSNWFRDYYILPMGGAIWSCSDKAMLDFPAVSFVNFFENHGLLSITNRPQWYTLKNKSIDYVETLERRIVEKCVIQKNSSIQSVKRTDGHVIITVDGTNHMFNDVIFACHPTQIKAMLMDASSAESNFLSKFKCLENSVYTHNDPAQMPLNKKCWSSWNYLYKKAFEKSAVSVTYWMNKLQHIPNDTPLFVTLNPIKPIPDSHIYDVHAFYHPVFDRSAIDGQRQLETIQGKNGLWFCGAYLRYGFHEDGIWSTVTMLDKMGISHKW